MQPPADESALTLEVLAERSGVPARTIRYYRSAGLLPQPDRRGRRARYSEAHLERLRTIGELRERGLSLGAIGALLDEEAAGGFSAAEWLRLDDALRHPWSDDRPVVVDDDELDELSGGRAGPRHAELTATGFLERNADGTWLVPSPTLLDAALRLDAVGVDIQVSARARDLLRRRLARSVNDTLDLFVEAAGSGFPDLRADEEVRRAIDTLRPITREACAVILAHEIEHGLARLLEHGTESLSGRWPGAPGGA